MREEECTPACAGTRNNTDSTQPERGYSFTYHNVIPRYHNVIRTSALWSEAAEASAPAAPTGAIATRPFPDIGPRVVGRVGF